MENEVWKDIYFKENDIINDYKGLYQVSNLGRVRSLNRYDSKKRKIKGTVLKIRHESKKRNYIHYSLNKDGKSKEFKAHRLVAIMFIPNPEGKPQVNHIDGNPENNNVENLEWCTNGENIKHAYKNNLIERKIGKRNFKSKSIMQYDKNGNFIKKWESMLLASKTLNINYGQIVYYCDKDKLIGNYYWRSK